MTSVSDVKSVGCGLLSQAASTPDRGRVDRRIFSQGGGWFL